jgi:hypothetical protein
MPELPVATEAIVFRSWLLDIRGAVFPGTPVATVVVGQKVYRVLANGEGFLWTKLAQPGDRLKVGQSLGNIAADGENIPYGKPYSLAEPES